MVLKMDAVTAFEAAIGAKLVNASLDGTREPPFAVLDFDNTCIVNDAGEAGVGFMCRNHLLRCGDLLALGGQPCNRAYHEQVFRHYYHLLNGGDIRSASLLCAGIFAGFKPDEAAAVASAVLDAEG